ncbi:MAG: Rne/Rng family ribonuclease [Planctomycetota bacterium]
MGRRRRGGQGRTGGAVGRKLLINSRESAESRIAILEGARLEEYYIERESLGSTLGNIYKARISNIEKSIGAAFVEFGHSRQGFLHVSDLCMAAVIGDQARSLLASVQAARESAHDDDVVDISTPAAAAAGSGAEPEAAGQAEPLGAAAAHESVSADSVQPTEDDEGFDEEDGLTAEAEGYGVPAEALVHSPDAGSGEEGSEELEELPDDAETGDLVATKKEESLAFAKGQDEDGLDDPDDSEGPDEADDGDEQAGGASSEPNGAAGGESPAGQAGDGSTRGGRRDDDRRRGGRRRGRRGGKPRERLEPREMPPIQDILQKGQEIVVQVIKDGIGTKGPTLTTYLSIPGRFVVLMPGINKRGVSRKVLDNAERERLKDIVRILQVPEGLGFIVRTAGTGATREDLQRDLDYLLRLWEQMRTRIQEHSAPVLLYQENDLVIRTLRDMYDGQGEVVVDDRGTLEKARQFMSEILPSCTEKVRLYDGERPLFSFFNVEDEIARLLENRIELRSGGSLIIEQTEALVAIDVNSGRFKAEGGSGIEDTAFAVNSEAAIEIARQIRLRDLGGVVVVDFIDMRSERHRKALENLFKESLRRDRARIKVARFSPFGIIELTRQRVRPSLKRTVHQRCPYCAGTGYIPSDETSCLNVVRKIRDNLSRPGSALVVVLRPEVAEAVLNQQRKALLEMEQQARKGIFIRSDHRLSYEDVEVRAMVALPDDLDHRRA